MSFKPSMLIANFTCRFGDKKVLLDMFDEIVRPAFFDSPPRKYGKNAFFLFDLALIDVADKGSAPEPVLAGNFVRDLALTRSHILRDTELVPSPGEMESATSARFVLVLSSHTLLYVPETPHAPPLTMFRSTMHYHLVQAWAKYLKAEVKRRRKERKGIKAGDILTELLKEFPRPELDIVELPSTISISDFLARFKKINRVEFKINDTNHSTSFKPLIEQLRAEKQATGSKGITIIETSPTNTSELGKQLEEVTKDGNIEAKVNGKGHSGEIIKGTNENFRLSIPLDGIPKKMKAFVESVFSTFSQLKAEKEIVVHRATGLATNKLEDIAKSASKTDATQPKDS